MKRVPRRVLVDEAAVRIIAQPGPTEATLALGLGRKAIEDLFASAADAYTRPYDAVIRYPLEHPRAGRFNTARFGAVYLAESQTTAIAEVRHRLNRHLAHESIGPMLVKRLAYVTHVKRRLYTVRSKAWQDDPIYSPQTHAHGQRFATELHNHDPRAPGITYNSVRRRTGHCLAMYDSTGIAMVRYKGAIHFRWDGRHISETLFTAIAP